MVHFSNAESAIERIAGRSTPPDVVFDLPPNTLTPASRSVHDFLPCLFRLFRAAALQGVPFCSLLLYAVAADGFCARPQVTDGSFTPGMSSPDPSPWPKIALNLQPIFCQSGGSAPVPSIQAPVWNQPVSGWRWR